MSNVFVIRKKIIFAILIFYSIFAYFSKGFFHYDEHYQILEFLSYKLGHISGSDLAWEFKSQVRPWMQIYFYYLSYKIINFVVPSIDPFYLASIFRIESAILSVFSKLIFLNGLSRVFLINSDNINVRQNKFVLKWTVIILFFFWFFPYFAARTSSENFSSSFILIAFGIFFLSLHKLSLVPGITHFSLDRLNQKITINHINSFFIGCLFGFAFQFRYQCLFIIFGVSLWILLNVKKRVQFLFVYSFGFLFVLCLGILIDKWGYGNYQLTFLKYFAENILYDKASGFGITPWYNYIKLLFSFDRIFGSSLILLYIISLVVYPKNFFIWGSLPFIVVHSFIGHKEMRFLFPVLPFIYVPSLNFFYFIKFHVIEKNLVFQRLLTNTNVIFCVLNCILFLKITLFPRHVKKLNLLDFMQHKSDFHEYYSLSNEIDFRDADPLLISFYELKNIKQHKVESEGDIQRVILSLPEKSSIYFFLNSTISNYRMPQAIIDRCSIVYADSGFSADSGFKRKFISDHGIYQTYIKLASNEKWKKFHIKNKMWLNTIWKCNQRKSL